MKNSVEQFNDLHGKVVSRNRLISLKELAEKQNQKEVATRLSKLLKGNPIGGFLSAKGKTFRIEIDKRAKWKAQAQGLGCPGVPANERCPCKDDETHGLEMLPLSLSEEFGLGKPVSPNEIYQYITDLVVNTINRDGLLPWQKSWESTGLHNGYEAINYISKKGYRGINYFLLNFEIKEGKDGPYLAAKKYTNPYFLTFKQVEKLKGKIKKGTHGHRVVYFTKLYGHSEKTKNGKLEYYSYDPKKVLDWIKKNRSQINILKRKGWTPERLAQNYIPILKYYNVFNADDIEGIKWDKVERNNNATRKQSEKIEIAESIISKFPTPPKIVFGGDQPAYIPRLDSVRMTPLQQFKNPQSYYSVLFHELIHSTGHKKRLDRLEPGGKRSKAYAKEELVAEMGAVFLCAESGILFQTINNNAAYLKGWNKRLASKMEKDNRFFFRAASKAQEAADYILQPNTNGIPLYRSKKGLSSPSRATVRKKGLNGYGKLLPGYRYAKGGKIVKSKIRAPKQKNEVNNNIKRTSRKAKPSTLKKGLGSPIVLNGGNPVVSKKRPTGGGFGDFPPQVSDIEVVAPKVVEPPKQPKPQKRRRFGRSIGSVGQKINHVYTPKGELAHFLGGIEVKPKGSVVVTLDAEQGAGKTRFFFQAIDSYASAGYSTSFFSLEEHPDSSVFTAKRDQYLGPVSQNNVLVLSEDDFDTENFGEVIEESEVIFIDSHGKLNQILGGIDLDTDLRKKYNGKLFFVIYQRTSDGKMRGGSSSAFDADVVAKVQKDMNGRNHKVYFNKNRYENTPGLMYNINKQMVEYPDNDDEEIDIPSETTVLA